MRELEINSLSENPNRHSKSFFIIYILVILLALIWLFRKFIFSDCMLISHDIIGFGVFYRKFLWDSFLEYGSIPGWNPYICCGLPFVDAIHGGIFYPLSILDFAGNMFRAIGYNFIFHYFLSGIFMYMTARQLGLSKLPASFAGISYMFSPCLISWVAPGHDGKIYAATFFPLLIYFLDRIFTKQGLLNIALFGLVYGIIILTPHLQMAYYISLVIALYSLYKLFSLYKQAGNFKQIITKATFVTIGVFLGLSISSIQLLPSSNYLLKYSPRSTIQKGYGFASNYSLREEEALSQLVPEFSGANLKNGEMLYWGKK